jgi:small subunit ribosomal protein S6
MSTARQYELIYIVSPEASEQQVTDLHSQVESIVARLGGHLDNTENWGRRKLAYEIGRHKEGVYVLELITGSGDVIKELERRLHVSDQVIRQLTVRVDEELRVADRTRTRRKATVARRRTARGLSPEPEPREQQGGSRDDDGPRGDRRYDDSEDQR